MTRIGRWWKPAAILLIVVAAVQAAETTMPIARVWLALWRRGLPLTDHAVAIHAASGTDDVEMLSLLGAAGADFGAPDADGGTALHTAAAAGAANAAVFLVANGVHVDTQGRAGPPLAVALEEDHLVVARVLLEHGADARVVIGRERRPAPVQMALSGDVRKMKLLLSLGIPPDVAGADGLTALAHAVSRNDEPMARALLEAGATTRSGTTGPDRSLLEQAIRNGQMDMVELLLAHGASATALSREGQPLLALAVALGRVDIATALLDAGVAVDTELAPLPAEQFLALVPGKFARFYLTRDEGMTPLTVAVLRGDLAMTRLLVARGASTGPTRGALQVSARFGRRTAHRQPGSAHVSAFLHEGDRAGAVEWARASAGPSVVGQSCRRSEDAWRIGVQLRVARPGFVELVEAAARSGQNHSVTTTAGISNVPSGSPPSHRTTVSDRRSSRARTSTRSRASDLRSRSERLATYSLRERTARHRRTWPRHARRRRSWNTSAPAALHTLAELGAGSVVGLQAAQIMTCVRPGRFAPRFARLRYADGMGYASPPSSHRATEYDLCKLPTPGHRADNSHKKT